MHLINIHTVELEHFTEGSIPPYAILSHRWGSEADELNFKEVSKKRCNTSKKGYRKLVRATQKAAEYDVHYLWIDTCCIDKRSSAELSEAINSMFLWYEESAICLAYLEDVQSEPNSEESFKNSVWFTRSWTLQELLAPQRVHFFDDQWTYIGDKENLARAIESVTGIDDEVLRKEYDLSETSIATRMSWAANRTATRSEDVAYSLMGIFDVNMPLLYGEREKAFSRLQEEIIRRTHETTFLAWSIDNDPKDLLLARSPADFVGAKERRVDPVVDSRSTFGLTNVGLEIEGKIIRVKPDIYGLLIGVTPETGYFLTFVTLNQSNVGLKTGICELNGPLLVWYKERKVTILRTSVPRIGSDLDDWPENFGFTIKAEAGVSVRPIEVEYGEFEYGLVALGEVKNEIKIHTHKWSAPVESSSKLTCAFDGEMRPATAKISCTTGSEWTFYIDLSFDFDFRPCALLYKGDSNGRVWEISDSVGANKSATDLDQREHKWTHVLDDDRRSTSFFLRAEGHRMVFAKVPESLAYGECSVWASFAPPSYNDFGLDYWTFAMSTVKPEPEVQSEDGSTDTDTGKDEHEGED